MVITFFAPAQKTGRASKTPGSILGRHNLYKWVSFRSAPTGKTLIGRPSMGKRLGAPIFSIVTPLRDGAGQVIGTLVGTINLGQPNFLDKITDSHYGKTGGYLLTAPQYRLIVTASEKNRIMQALPPVGVNTMLDRYMQGYEGYGISVNSRGVEELTAAKGIPVAGWFMGAVVPTAEAFAPVVAMQQRMLLATLLLTLLTGALIWWVLKRQLAPLLATAGAMTALADSKQIPQPLAETHHGEIGLLVAGFNRILEKSVQREASLKASESFKDVVLNSLDAEIAVVDRTGVILAVNARWQQFAVANSLVPGEPAQHTGVGTNYLAVCGVGADGDTDGVLTAHAGLQAVLEGRLPSFSCEYPCDSPTQQRWFAMMAMPLGEAGRGGAVITHTDISPRKQSEKAMQRMQTMMERTESMAHLASFQWEVDTNTVTWSPEMFRLLGRDPALGVPNLEGQAQLYTPASTQILFEAVSKAVADGTPYDLELTAVRPDGERRHVFARGFPERDGNARVVRIYGLVQDITERKRKEETIRLAASVFSHAREGITIANADGIIIDINEAFSRITGYSREEAIGQNPRILQSGRHDKAFYETMWRDLTGPGHWSSEIWNQRKNGEVYAELLTISAVRDAQGNTQNYVALFSDITGIKEQQNQLEKIAHFDALTNLPNRRMLEDRLNQAMATSKRNGLFGALMFLDLDNFKPLNDTHGHSVGDLLLVEVARRLSACVREVDTVARTGGDEFVVVLSELDADQAQSRELAAGVAEKIRLSLAAPYRLTVAKPGQNETTVEHHCSVSIGVVLFTNHAASQPDVVKWADAAMYQAKAAGRNVVRFYEPNRPVAHAN
jgi:diguanylate cyclase (GGDEF)-like protein/PAS domain S-box-containing protein